MIRFYFIGLILQIAMLVVDDLPDQTTFIAYSLVREQTPLLGNCSLYEQ